MLQHVAGLCLLLCLGLTHGQTLRVKTPDGRSTVLDAAALAALPSTRTTATAHDKSASYTTVDLLDVLRAVGMEPPQAIRGPALKRVLLARAADGYAAAFSWAELDPSIGGKKVLLALERPGTPLDAQAGPLRLVVPSENRPTRWVRQLTDLDVLDLP